MHHRRWIIASASLLFGIGVACSSMPLTQDPATDDGQLTSVTSSEIVGFLNYGQTSAPVSYVSSPRYRAFGFNGVTGDAVDIVVHSTQGAMAWLVDNNATTIAYDFASGHDAHIAQSLSATRTYFIVFREPALQTSTFTVSLARIPTVDGGTPLDGSSDAEVDSGNDGTIASDATNDSTTSDVLQDAGTDATADSNTSDVVIDGGNDGAVTCTFSRTLTGATGCSACLLPSATTMTDTLSAVIDDAGGGATDKSIDGGQGRTLHFSGVSNEFTAEGCFSVFALDGVPPSESWSTTLGFTACAFTNSNANITLTVSSGDQLSVSYDVAHYPGVSGCLVQHGCVLEKLDCSGNLTAVQQ